MPGHERNLKHSVLGLPYRRDGKTDNPIKGFRGEYRFLSNFYDCAYSDGSINFFCSEQGYMFEKSCDPEYRKRILACTSAYQCKTVGRHAKLNEDWDSIKRYEAMLKHLRLKFAVPAMRDLILATQNRYLEETNYHYDVHWGVSAQSGKGQNHLGRLLMCVREELK